MQKSRIVWLDIMRGILILGMVASHAGWPFTREFYLFHMGAFIMLSGYTLRSLSSLRDHFQQIKKDILRLLCPFYVINTIMILVYHILMHLHLYRYIPEDMMRPFGMQLRNLFSINPITPDLGGATWFLLVLFASRLIWSLLSLLLRAIRSLTVRRLFLLIPALIGWSLIQKGKALPFLLDLGLFACLFLFLGMALRQYNVLESLNQTAAVSSSCVVFFFFARLYFGYDIAMNLPTRSFPSLVITLACVLSGFILCYYLSRLLEKIPLYSGLLKVLSDSSLTIMCWHFFFFRLTNMAAYKLGLIPSEDAAVLTPVQTGNMEWLFYSFIALFLSVLLYRAAAKTKLTNYIFNGRISLISEKEAGSVKGHGV